MKTGKIIQRDLLQKLIRTIMLTLNVISTSSKVSPRYKFLRGRKYLVAVPASYAPPALPRHPI
jgi:hypothetical protein